MDVYSYFLEEFRTFAAKKLRDENFLKEKDVKLTSAQGKRLAELVLNSLILKHIKDIYMPMLYGKTEGEAATHLQKTFVEPNFLAYNQSQLIIKLSREFFKSRYSGWIL